MLRSTIAPASYSSQEFSAPSWTVLIWFDMVLLNGAPVEQRVDLLLSRYWRVRLEWAAFSLSQGVIIWPIWVCITSVWMETKHLALLVIARRPHDRESVTDGKEEREKKRNGGHDWNEKRTTWWWKTNMRLGGGLLGMWNEQGRSAKRYWTRHLINTQNTREAYM